MIKQNIREMQVFERFQICLEFLQNKKINFLTIRGLCRSKNGEKSTAFCFFDLKLNFVLLIQIKVLQKQIIMCSPYGVKRKTSDSLIVDSNNFLWIRGLKLIFSGEFDYWEPSVANFVVNVFQYDIRSRSKYVLYTLVGNDVKQLI